MGSPETDPKSCINYHFAAISRNQLHLTQMHVKQLQNRIVYSTEVYFRIIKLYAKLKEKKKISEVYFCIVKLYEKEHNVP